MGKEVGFFLLQHSVQHLNSCPCLVLTFRSLWTNSSKAMHNFCQKVHSFLISPRLGCPWKYKRSSLHEKDRSVYYECSKIQPRIIDHTDSLAVPLTKQDCEITEM